MTFSGEKPPTKIPRFKRGPRGYATPFYGSQISLLLKKARIFISQSNEDSKLTRTNNLYEVRKLIDIDTLLLSCILSVSIVFYVNFLLESYSSEYFKLQYLCDLK